MINYKIHYAMGCSPQERRARGEKRDILAYHVDEHVIPRPFIIFEKVFNEAVKAINELLKTPNGSNGKLFVYNAYSYKSFRSLEGLLAIIIPQLEELEKMNSAKGNQPQQNINKEVIEELKRIKNAVGVNPATIMKVLVQFEIPGIKRIEFTNDNTGINQETLLDIEYSMDLVPDRYNCSVLMTIMSDPIVATFTETVDRAVTVGFPTNPFTRQPWFEIRRDAKLFAEINDFVKRVEWLYYAFQDNKQYQYLYHDPRVTELLQDNALSFADFKTRINQYLCEQTTRSVIFTQEKPVVYPCKYVLDLFSQNAMHVLRPTKQDYEKLIRRLAVAGDAVGLERLLHSPVLDFIKIDIYARNDKGQNVLDLLNSYRYKHSELRSKYDQCSELLTGYQEPSSNDIPSMRRWFSEQANTYLPSFNRYNVLATLATLASVGTAIYLGSNSSDAPSTTPNL